MTDNPTPRARPIRRRRFLAIAAATAGVAAATAGVAAATGVVVGAGIPRGGRGAAPVWRWRGSAMGADAEIVLAGIEAGPAAALIADCVAEIDRLEACFSLYRADSELSRLNRSGALERPSPDFRRLLGESLDWWAASDGAFNIAVQPLWRLYADHFADPAAATDGPPPAAIRAAARLADPSAIEVGAGGVRLGRPGMALTLNGIAQGYVTDRVAGRLAAAGLVNTLVDLGEYRALGPEPGGRPWRVWMRPAPGAAPIDTGLAIAAGAVATSSATGTRFDRDGRFHHLLAPDSGTPAQHHVAVTVLAPTATAADALSTAAFVGAPAGLAALAGRAPGARIMVLGRDGHMRSIAGGA